MAVQSGSTIYTNDASSYLSVNKYDIIQYSDYNQVIATIDNLNETVGGLNQTIDNLNQTIENLKKSIGGKIFYDAGNNGATYTFYDSSGNVITDTSISGLQNAVKYKIEGNPTKDRYYVVYPSLLNNGEHNVTWGFQYNADIIVITGTAIGTGKTNTQAIWNYINTYASNETAIDNGLTSPISQASHNGYNLYKNCSKTRPYLWDVIRDTNNNSLEGCHDWFIPSKDELYQLKTSGVIPDCSYLWTSSSSHLANGAWCLLSSGDFQGSERAVSQKCVACRAF